MAVGLGGSQSPPRDGIPPHPYPTPTHPALHAHAQSILSALSGASTTAEVEIVLTHPAAGGEEEAGGSPLAPGVQGPDGSRRLVDVRVDKERRVQLPLYLDGEAVCGKVRVRGGGGVVHGST